MRFVRPLAPLVVGLFAGCGNDLPKDDAARDAAIREQCGFEPGTPLLMAAARDPRGGGFALTSSEVCVYRGRLEDGGLWRAPLADLTRIAPNAEVPARLDLADACGLVHTVLFGAEYEAILVQRALEERSFAAFRLDALHASLRESMEHPPAPSFPPRPFTLPPPAAPDDPEEAKDFAARAKDPDASCRLAQSSAHKGDKDAAFFYLQECFEDAVEPSDFRSAEAALGKDPRWPKLVGYAQGRCAARLRGNVYETHLAGVPKGAARPRMPLVVWLHGYGATPDVDDWENLAKESGVAMLGVSASYSKGDHTFRWAEDLRRDALRVHVALDVAAQYVDATRVLLFGFSQGAALAADLLLHYPSTFAGALVLSPGQRLRPPGEPTQEDLTGRTMHCYVGGMEHAKTLAFTEYACEEAKKNGASVFRREEPRMNQHTFPPEFDAAFGKWVRATLGTPEKPPQPR